MSHTQSMNYWETIVSPYKNPTLSRSFLQLLSTIAVFGMVAYAMYLTVNDYYAVTLLLSIINGLLLVRFFIIQHDCGHGSFFKSQKANDRLGPWLSIFTMTPYAQWAKEHNRHHATSGNLSHRGVGDVTTWTVEEYKNNNRVKKFFYRLYRHPLFLFTIGAMGHFLVKQRVPFYRPKRLSSWASVMFTNIYMAVVLGGFTYWLGAETFLKIYVPIVFVASSVGTWMFYIQHQYENTYWEKGKDWNYCDAAIHGSSFYDLPKILHWFTGNIGYHHIHHLSSKIPNYNLAKCFYENPELQNPYRMSLWDSRKCLSMALWDESKKKMVGFRDVA